MSRALKEGELIAKMVTTTNHGLMYYANREGILVVSTYARWYGEEGRDDTFHTSALRSYELDGSRLTLHTLNSTYVFEIIQGEFDAFAFTRANEAMIKEYDAINAAKYDRYWCQIAAVGMIDGAMTVTKLPYAMNLQEARDYLNTNLLTDGEGNIVTNIMGACTERKRHT